MGLVVGIVQLVTDKELGCRVGATSSAGLNLFDNFGVNLSIADRFHHGQVFEVVVCLEQGVASEELDNNAADAPYVAWKAPSQVQNYFGGSVMPG